MKKIRNSYKIPNNFIIKNKILPMLKLKNNKILLKMIRVKY